MADWDLGSFRVADEGSELLHRPIQTLAVRGQADFLSLCVQLRIPILNTHHDAQTIMSGASPAGCGASSSVFDTIENKCFLRAGEDFINPSVPSDWFPKEWLDLERDTKINVHYVFKRIEPDFAEHDALQPSPSTSSAGANKRRLASITNEVRILSNKSIRSSKNIICLLAVSWYEALSTDWGGFWPQVLLERADLGTLQSCLSQNKILKSTKLMLFRDLLNGVKYLHANGVVHGDIKPANVLLCHDALFEKTDFAGEGFGLMPVKAKLCDFGFSIILSDYGTNLPFRARMGTWPWMAPEMDGHSSIPTDLLVKADIFSLGLLLVSMVRDGQPPFLNMSKEAVSAAKNSSGALEVLNAELHQNQGSRRRSGLTRLEIGRVILLLVQMMAPQPKDRVGIDTVISQFDILLHHSISNHRRCRGLSHPFPQYVNTYRGAFWASVLRVLRLTLIPDGL